MGVNVGSFLAPLVCGYFGETGNPHDFRWGFLIAAIVTVLTVVLFETQKNKYLIGPRRQAPRHHPRRPQGTAPGRQHRPEECPCQRTDHAQLPAARPARHRACRFLLLVLRGRLDKHRHLHRLHRVSRQHPAGRLTHQDGARPHLRHLHHRLLRHFLLGGLRAGRRLAHAFASEQTDRVILGWEMPASWIQSFNPFFVVILAAIMPGVWGALGKRGMEPASPTKQAIGLLLLSLGYLVICFGVKDVQPGIKVSLIWLTGLYFIHTMGEICLSPIGLSMVNKLTPIRFASLMMGIWYLSTATANKFAGTLSGLYPEAGKVKTLLGYRIETMYDFFMVFVVMSATASLILFLLSKKLQKMMHGVE